MSTTQNAPFKALQAIATIFVIWYFLGDYLVARWWPLGKPDVTVAVEKITKELSGTNKATALEQYKKMTVEVTGPAYRVDIAFGYPVVSLGRMFNNLECHLDKNSMERASSIKPGQTVRVKGRVNAGGFFTVLNPCELI